ncbi:MAG: hypothetical protein ACR652_11570 [Methylocystis sp.]|uniref:hypothetical protein n=1 Tax=Methylocystis sp. TaxID=1911079 RepID=UPI003DA2B7CD
MKKFLVSFAVFTATVGTAYAGSGSIGSPQINVPVSINMALPVQVQTGVALGIGLMGGTGVGAVGQYGGQSANAQQLISNILSQHFTP